MAIKYTQRKIEEFALHARHLNTEKNVDYKELFKLYKARAENNHFQHSFGDKLVAVTQLDITDNHLSFIAYEGEHGVNPIIFNATNNMERIEELGKYEVVASRTHGIIDFVKRKAVIEYNHRGAKASHIAEVLEVAGRSIKGFGDLTLDLNPVPDGEFAKALSKFQTVKVANLQLARPNYDWNDYFDKTTEIAQESEAGIMNLELHASRGSSLSTKSGIVPFIKDIAQKGMSMIKNVTITGTRKGEEVPTKISFKNFISHQKVNVRKTQDGLVEKKDIMEKIGNFLKAIK